MVSPDRFDELREQGEMIWENRRYGSSYGVDRSALLAFAKHQVPVLHLGQVAAINTIKRSTPAIRWLVVSLWCPRNVAAERIAARSTGDTAERLVAWDQTESASAADLEFDTADTKPAEIARAVLAQVGSSGLTQDPGH